MPLSEGASSSGPALIYSEAPWVRKRVVGRGNFGKARLLENEDTGELVVSKEAKLDGTEEARRKQSSDWSKEVDLHSKLSHPHIIGYRGSFQQNDMFCIVMDYAAGGTLDGRIARQREAGESFCAEMILRWLAEMASALEHMHSHRVLHRDMKPANVLLSAEGEIKLADFGVSRLLGSQTSLAQTVLGTPFYMSPELFKGEPYSQPTDVWALGVVLFELLTLQRPFTGDNIGVVMTRISRCDFDVAALEGCPHPQELKLLVSGEGSHRSLLHPDPEARCTLAQLLEAEMVPEMTQVSAVRPAEDARGPPAERGDAASAPGPPPPQVESVAVAPQPAESAAAAPPPQVEYFATLEVAVRNHHVVSRPRRSSMSPATRPRHSVSSRPRASMSPPPPSPPRPAAATEAPPPPPPPLVSPRARGSPSVPRRVWPASPLMPPKTPDEGRALRANLEQVLSDHNSRRSSVFAAVKPEEHK